MAIKWQNKPGDSSWKGKCFSEGNSLEPEEKPKRGSNSTPASHRALPQPVTSPSQHQTTSLPNREIRNLGKITPIFDSKQHPFQAKCMQSSEQLETAHQLPVSLQLRNAML